jgi:peptidoglycan/LPS O-acetylase OafA/YrhL
MKNEPNAPCGVANYYPHIDGIRALAVIPVVVNHIYAALCPGGFAGVDVFFVISGYLISGGLLRDLQNDRFSIAEFYFRRIRRILPAYFAVMLGVFCVGMLVYYAAPMRDLLDVMLAGTFFSSNLYFWIWSGDYFGPAVRNNPLMHLWSLSVEEQFYFFIPLLYASVWKIGRRWLMPIFAGIAACSLAGAIWTISRGDVKSAFYLFHWRAWELLAGGLLAMFVPQRWARAAQMQSAFGRRLSTLGTWVGFALILATYGLVTEKTPFPGVAALAPVLGTVVLILGGWRGTIGSVLSQKHVVGVGKISYSLYLVHWPVIVFWRWLTYDTLFLPDYFGMALVGVLLAWFSWRWVEQPARLSAVWSRRKAFLLAGCGMTVLVVLSSVCLLNQCWPEKLHVAANAASGEVRQSRFEIVACCGRRMQRMASLVDKWMGTRYKDHMQGNRLVREMERGSDGFQSYGNDANGVHTLIVGDCHAGMLKKGAMTWALQHKQTISVLSVSATDMFDPEESIRVVGLLNQMPSVSRVVLVERWGRHNNNAEIGGMLDHSLRRFIDRIQALGKIVYIVSDSAVDRAMFEHDRRSGEGCSVKSIRPKMTMLAPRFFLSEWEDYLNGQPVETYEKMQGNINRVLTHVCETTEAVLIPLQACLAPRENLWVLC